MFEARIVSPRGTLYVAAEGTPYDLEVLRMHLCDGSRKGDGHQAEVRADAVDAVTLEKASWLHQLADEGVRVRLSPVRRRRHGPGVAA